MDVNGERLNRSENLSTLGAADQAQQQLNSGSGWMKKRKAKELTLSTSGIVSRLMEVYAQPISQESSGSKKTHVCCLCPSNKNQFTWRGEGSRWVSNVKNHFAISHPSQFEIVCETMKLEETTRLELECKRRREDFFKDRENVDVETKRKIDLQLTKFIILSDLPITMVENTEFREFLEVIRPASLPAYVPATAKTVSAYITQFRQGTHACIKDTLSEATRCWFLPSVSICWALRSTSKKDSILGLMAYVVHPENGVTKAALGLDNVVGSHTSNRITEWVSNCVLSVIYEHPEIVELNQIELLEKFEGKVSTQVSYGARNCKSACTMMKIPIYRCAAHRAKLAVQKDAFDNCISRRLSKEFLGLSDEACKESYLKMVFETKDKRTMVHDRTRANTSNQANFVGEENSSESLSESDDEDDDEQQASADVEGLFTDESLFPEIPFDQVKNLRGRMRNEAMKLEELVKRVRVRTRLLLQSPKIMEAFKQVALLLKLKWLEPRTGGKSCWIGFYSEMEYDYLFHEVWCILTGASDILVENRNLWETCGETLKFIKPVKDEKLLLAELVGLLSPCFFWMQKLQKEHISIAESYHLAETVKASLSLPFVLPDLIPLNQHSEGMSDTEDDTPQTANQQPHPTAVFLRKQLQMSLAYRFPRQCNPNLLATIFIDPRYRTLFVGLQLWSISEDMKDTNILAPIFEAMEETCLTTVKGLMKEAWVAQNPKPSKPSNTCTQTFERAREVRSCVISFRSTRTTASEELKASEDQNFAAELQKWNASCNTAVETECTQYYNQFILPERSLFTKQIGHVAITSATQSTSTSSLPEAPGPDRKAILEEIEIWCNDPARSDPFKWWNEPFQTTNENGSPEFKTPRTSFPLLWQVFGHLFSTHATTANLESFISQASWTETKTQMGNISCAKLSDIGFITANKHMLPSISTVYNQLLNKTK